MTLDSVKRFTRASYKAEMGEQAPPFNPNLYVKAWIDFEALTLPDSTPMTYLYINQMTGEVESFTMTAAEAQRVNLPGPYEYPHWVPAPTPAYRTMHGQRFPINPRTLTTEAQAQEIASALNATVVPHQLGMMSEHWEGEERRDWQIMGEWGGANAGTLLAMQYQAGVGHPGKWTVKNGEPYWEPAPQVIAHPAGSPMAREIPTPIRPLKKDEIVVRSLFGGWVVVKKVLTIEDRLEALEEAIFGKQED